MRNYALIILMIFSLILLSSFVVDAAFDFYIGEQLVELTAPMIVVNGYILIPITVLEQYMAAQLKYSSDLQEVNIEFPIMTIDMQVGTTNAYVNGEEQLLDVAPEYHNDELMIPLRFIADVLGFRLVFDDSQRERATLVLYISEDIAQMVEAQDESSFGSFTLPEFLDPSVLEDSFERPILHDIEFIGGSRSQVFIDIEGYAAYESFLLTNPDRLVIDLCGVQWKKIPDQDIDGVIVQRIRSEQHDERTVRIVFELNKVTNYRIHRWPDGGLEIEFNYQIGDIGYYRDQEDIPRLWFKANEQPTFQQGALPSPLRLVLDFQDSTLLDGAREFTVDDSVIRQIRISQYTSSVARIVLDLEDNAPLTAAYVEQGDERYEIVFFEGTADEYQALLDQEDPIPAEPEIIVPEADPADADKPLYGRIIVIDPGHGGSDPGTIKNVLGVYEKEIVLEIGLRLGELLEEAGALVVYTRTDDSYVSTFDRPKIANLANAELLVSIHANSYEGTSARGVETLYNPLYLENFRLAQSVQSELAGYIEAVNRGVRPRTDLAVLNQAEMTAVLVEVGFVSHEEEVVLLTSSEYQQKIADGLFNGIQLFFITYR